MYTKIEVIKLPSGFYSVWIDGNWIDASFKTESEAEKFMLNYIKRYS